MNVYLVPTERTNVAASIRRSVPVALLSEHLDTNVVQSIKEACEVKRDWNLTRRDASTLGQAFKYAHEIGAPYVVITNGDYYAMYDRSAGGLSYDDYFFGEFKISEFDRINPSLINRLSKAALMRP